MSPNNGSSASTWSTEPPPPARPEDLPFSPVSRLTGWREGRGWRCLRVAAWICSSLAGFSARGEAQAAAGITEAICDTVLSPAVAGLVSAWKFKEGDFVKQGDVIIELDSAIETLETTRRRLVMENRKADWEAVQTLFKKSSISVKKEDLDKAETEYRIAVAEHEMATEQLRKRRITAPCPGYVAEIIRDVGEACDAYQPIARVVDTRQCYFISNVESKLAGSLKLGQSVKLEIETSAELAVLSGSVVFLSPVVDPASGLRRVKVLFDNAEGRIHPGVAGKMMF